MVMNSALKSPKTRPHLPRISSSESGFFFWHQTAPAGDAVAQFEPSEFFARIENPVLGQAAQVEHGRRRSVQKIEREIAVGGNVHAVLAHIFEAELTRDGLAIEGEATA